MQIRTKKDLKETLKYERQCYLSNNKKRRLFNSFTNENMLQIYKFIKLLRKEEFYYSLYAKTKSIYSFIKFSYLLRKKNKLGNKLGLFLPRNVVDKGVVIYHSGDVVINKHASIGANCKLHGNNCIGNDGYNLDKAPQIGNNVDIGYGAVVIGDISIANNIKIGAGAVVVKSCDIEGATLVGCPARVIKCSQD